MEVRDLSALLSDDPDLGPGFVHREEIAARSACYGSLGRDLPFPIRQYLDSSGIQLYSHQCDAIEAFRSGESIVLTTPTASGKTLAFALPVFERILDDPESTFLFIYPTKALTHDQLRTLQSLDGNLHAGSFTAVYDGDTETGRRSHIRRTARIILTNPHELHHILSWHHQWSRFFSGLEGVIIDEAHRYRGVFGSHVALLVRRLTRIARHYGSDPLFFLSTATLANPGQFASRLCGKSCREITQDGSPHGSRIFLFYNPYRSWPNTRSVHQDTATLTAQCVSRGLQTLCFTGSRKIAELVALRAGEIVSGGGRTGGPRISAYRAGFLPEERRQIESDLRTGMLRGVVSTNALEVGIDAGSLDGVILSGFPGTMMAAWQQAGRAGRSGRESLALLVAYSNPLDQYFMHHPESFFQSSHEHAIIDLENPYILSGQVLCAGAELPLDCKRDLEFFGPALPGIVAAHARESLLGKTRRGWIYSGSRRAQDLVGLDGGSRETFRILSGGRVLETMDRSQAFREAHPGAILLHQGEQYRIDSFSLETRTIQATPVEVDYYTRPLNSVRITIKTCRNQRPLPGGCLCFGDVEVTEQYTSYKLLKAETIIGIEPLDLPPLQFSTTALWITVPPDVTREISLQDGDLAGGLHGMEHVMIAVMPFHVLCDRWDLGGLSTPCAGDLGDPTVFIYDGYEGGIGLAEKGYEICETLMDTARTLVSECRCENGCPSCILSPKCGSDNQPLDKAATLNLISLVSGGVSGKNE